MKTVKIICFFFLLLLSMSTIAQEIKVKGRVTGMDGKPVAGALLSAPGVTNIATNEAGEFELTLKDKKAEISVWADGFYQQKRRLYGSETMNIVLVPTDKWRYSQELVLPVRTDKGAEKTTAADNIAKKDFGLGKLKVEDAMAGRVAGLQVIGKGGMPGEGSYINLRGIHSLVANTAPLIVIDGVPYMADMTASPLITGYSRSIFANYNVNDYQNITVLKGADASMYGSMGSNGVILIETDGAASDDLNTRISFNGQYGVNYKNKDYPLLNAAQYKNYLPDVGMTHFEDMSEMLTTFPFLKDDPSYYYKFIYNNNTDWQKEIFSPSFVTDNLLRVEGGDAIAKYDIAVGYTGERGILEKTKSDRYHTQINTNVKVGRKWEIFTTVGLAYMENDLQEQGMAAETNPMLVAYQKQPVLSPYKRNSANQNLVGYDTVRYGLSNPVAIVNSVEANTKAYDVNVRAGVNFDANAYLSLKGMFSLYYNYNREGIFIPGMDNPTIVHANYGRAENIVRSGVAEALNMYYTLRAAYSRSFGLHDVNAYVGGQVLTTRQEYDAGEGFNTINDFYKTLDKITNNKNVKFFGYNNEWNWMNYYAHVDYTFNRLVRASVNVALDAASSTGKDATRFGAFPSAGVALMLKNTPFFVNSEFVNRLTLRGEYGLTGNSRFSSNYGKNYYESAMFQVLSGIRRANIPNTNLKWENNKQLNVGLDLSLWNNRVDVSADYYLSRSEDVVNNVPISSVYGISTYYDNVGEIENKGFELSLQASLVRTRNFEWIVGGNIAFADSKVKSLGANVQEQVIELEDGAQIVTRVGEKPYQFYGWQANGVFSTTAEAQRAALTDYHGNAYGAGDMHYVNQNPKEDNIIDDKDRVLLGSALPDYHGAFYTSVRWRNLSLSADFTFSHGNKAYNGVRRVMESMSGFGNQAESVLKRWQVEGQVTDMPRAMYGDPMNNSGFSSRWIEDASYLKMKNITLSYTFNKTFLKLFRSGTIYVTGENLVCFTDYLGLDPEFAYSYDDSRLGCDYAKVPLAKTVKFGFNLKF